MLDLRHIVKKYPEFCLDDISFSLDKADYFVLLGPSGAGKTQVLEIIAGLIRPDKGKIILDGKDLTSIPIQKRPFGMVFQDHAIFPHMSIRQNLAYGLKNRKITSKEITAAVEEQASVTGITHLLDRSPATISGGELQRVALSRALIRKPQILLLDEPLASLDIPLRQGLRSLLKRLNRDGQTIIHVTHEYEEALLLANQVAVIFEGKIIQSGLAVEVFHHPRSEFVARFTGIRNYFPVVLHTHNDRQSARLNNGQEIRVQSEETDGGGFILLKSEDIVVSNEELDSSATNRFRGKIIEIFPALQGYELLVDAGQEFYVKITRESLSHLDLKEGKEIWISFKASGVRFVKM